MHIFVCVFSVALGNLPLATSELNASKCEREVCRKWLFTIFGAGNITVVDPSRYCRIPAGLTEPNQKSIGTACCGAYSLLLFRVYCAAKWIAGGNCIPQAAQIKWILAKVSKCLLISLSFSLYVCVCVCIFFLLILLFKRYRPIYRRKNEWDNEWKKKKMNGHKWMRDKAHKKDNKCLITWHEQRAPLPVLW